MPQTVDMNPLVAAELNLQKVHNPRKQYADKSPLANECRPVKNLWAAEYKHIVLGLIFLKYISDTFQARREELTRRFQDKNDDFFLHDCDAQMLADELNDRDYYLSENVFWGPEGARWEGLRSAVCGLRPSRPTSASALMIRSR